jgi:predicted amidophosphoribosyltransferase
VPYSLLDIVFPATCIVCGIKPKPLCQTCLPRSSVIALEGFDFPILTGFRHEGAIEKIIAGYKDQQLVSLERPLSQLLAQVFQEVELSQFSAIITPARNLKNYRKRGFDPANRLAKQAVRLLAQAPKVLSLSPTRKLEDQRRLGKVARVRNVAESMRLDEKLTGKALLFDDVLTTGSTIREMARACLAAGVEVGACCVLAQRISTF